MLKSVITGDIVASTDLSGSQRQELPDHIRKAYRRSGELFPEALPYDIDIFRGDSIQIYVEDPTVALPIAVQFRACMKFTAGVETRMALATDTVEFLKVTNISESDGKVFRRSGRALNELEDDHLICLAPVDVDDQYQLSLDVIAVLIDHLATGWTQAQAQAIALMIESLYQENEAHQKYVREMWSPMTISQQAVSKHLQSAAWKLVEKSFDWYRDTIGRIASQE